MFPRITTTGRGSPNVYSRLSDSLVQLKHIYIYIYVLRVKTITISSVPEYYSGLTRRIISKLLLLTHTQRLIRTTTDRDGIKCLHMYIYAIIILCESRRKLLARDPFDTIIILIGLLSRRGPNRIPSVKLLKSGWLTPRTNFAGTHRRTLMYSMYT